MAELGRRHGCDAFVTTAKDEVKLDAAMRLRLEAVAPLRIASLVVEMEDEERCAASSAPCCRATPTELRIMRKSPIVTAK